MRLPTFAVILAGGYGTRFWPLSRRARPKQFLALAGRESLLQQTYRRLRRVFPSERIYVVGNAEHRALLRSQLAHLPRGRLLLEPIGRNTAAGVALATVHIRARQRNAVLAVFPADHAIADERRFRRLLRPALATAAMDDVMVVLGIPPTHAHTGYGYIERGAEQSRCWGERVFRARRFTEKPNARTAARYLRSRRYYWNSGMFFLRLSAFDALLRRYLPRAWTAFQRITPGSSHARLARLYRRLENISIDYALAEPAARAGRVRVIPAEMGWSDLGSWSAVYDWQARRRGENILRGPGFLRDAAGNWISAPGKFVAALGIEDLVVVDTPDALLLCRRGHAQLVGKVVDYLRKKKWLQLL